ncbi:hypothetical protein [Acinetobacter beijerinckii]|uniref:Uncharacterized protein n=1 Tax=Acinetobacter beijerinckii CIP 110307 TaxID=1217648 RepID=N9F6I7_9GAMM|nr:hypothetical protein [Acinetobacter beijerinckii]ENW02930.1 hypothetical protein F933_03336 [Acinetobacter beijerinckii CIP 110307]
MTTKSNDQEKTPLERAITKFKTKNKRQPISIDLYLAKPVENEVFEKWQTIKNKKDFLMYCINHYDELNKQNEMNRT